MKNIARRAGLEATPFSAPKRADAGLDVELRLLVEDIYGPEVRDLPGLDIGRAYWGAREDFPYGGDIVDIFQYGDGCTSVAVIDISGHGIRAAKNAGLTKHALRAYVSQGLDPVESIRALNRLCIENCAFEGENEFFATAFVAIIDARRESMRYVSAGHESACIVREDGVRFLDATGPILGLLDDDYSFVQLTVELEPSDILAAVTDGFSEARDLQGAFLGRQALGSVIERDRTRSAEEQAQAITLRAFNFAGTRLHDDVAALVVKIADNENI